MNRSLPVLLVPLAVLAACGSNGANSTDNSNIRDVPNSPETPNTARPGGMSSRSNTDPYRNYNDTNRTASHQDRNYQVMPQSDTRILSILHAKNQHEIEMGRLAQQRGASEDVRSYGEMLVRDHSENDATVRSTADSAGITLIDPREMSSALAREKNLPPPPTDHAAEFNNMQGAAFDQQFAAKMLDGHRELIQIIEQARPNVTNAQVRDLLDRTLPVIRRHEEMASRLANR